MNMKKLLTTAMVMVAAFVVAGCGAASSGTQTQSAASGQKENGGAIVQTIPDAMQGKKMLVTYYSWGGNTRTVAQQIQQETGADLFEIQPAVPYPSDYQECVDVAKKEVNENARPAVANKVENMDQYDVIFVGYPIWWGKAPMFVYTFLEGYNLQGKTVVPFCTSGGSPIDGSIPDIQASAKGATVVQGIESKNSSAISQWLKKIHAVQ